MAPTPRETRTNKDKHGLGGDCATCKRRRVKCDRGPGACQKCEKRGFVCPGYGKRVQWVHDVATRGHQKGLQATFLENHCRLGLQRTAPESSTNDLRDTQDCNSGTSLETVSEREGIIPRLPSNPPPTDLETLKGYYRDHIARLMAWFHSDDNLYRTQVLSMVSTSPVLRLAISAISTLHWNATRQADQLPLAEDIRDQAVQSITASVRAITDSTEYIDLEMARWMLASIMVLSCCEMIELGATAADWHRRAARSLVNVVKTMAWREDVLLVFLMNQLSEYDVLSCTTSFDLADVQAAILPTARRNGPSFSRLLCLIHEITLQNRKSLVIPGDQREAPSLTCLQLRYELEMARGETLTSIGDATSYDRTQERDFVRLVDLYCKAALLYARQACREWKAIAGDSIIDDFFYTLKTFDEAKSLCQNLAWPLFIAGTEVREDPGKQEEVITIFAEIRSVTGFDHFRELVEFLSSFWSGSSSDWLSHAKQWEQRGKRILAV